MGASGDVNPHIFGLFYLFFKNKSPSTLVVLGECRNSVLLWSSGNVLRATKLHPAFHRCVENDSVSLFGWTSPLTRSAGRKYKHTECIEAWERLHTHIFTVLHTRSKNPRWHSLSLFSEARGGSPTNSIFFIKKKLGQNQTRKSVNIQYHKKVVCKMRVEQTASLKNKNAAHHMEFGDTHPLFHTQINTDLSGGHAGLFN